MKSLSTTLLALLLASCGSDSAPETAPADPAESSPAAEEAPAPERPLSETLSKEELITQMNADIQTFEAKPEHQAPQIKVQHLLVSFVGRGVPKAQRTKEEAEALAAELWQRIKEDEDFDGLVRHYTDDRHPGTYVMTLTGPPQQFLPGVGQVYGRSGMVPAFGNVGWRLEVGEIGVAPWDAVKSQYGWHIVKRLE